MTLENILLSLIYEAAWAAHIPSYTANMYAISQYLAKLER